LAYNPSSYANNELGTIYPQISTAHTTALALWKNYVAGTTCPT
jgi:hypothetical protein